MRNILTLALSFAVCLGLSAQEKVVSWQTDPVDGHRTGVMASNASNVTEAMGSVKGCAYYAPNGKRFRKGTTWIVAKIMLDGGDGYKVAKNAVELIKCNGYLCVIFGRLNTLDNEIFTDHFISDLRPNVLRTAGCCHRKP